MRRREAEGELGGRQFGGVHGCRARRRKVPSCLGWAAVVAEVGILWRRATDDVGFVELIVSTLQVAGLFFFFSGNLQRHLGSIRLGRTVLFAETPVLRA